MVTIERAFDATISSFFGAAGLLALACGSAEMPGKLGDGAGGVAPATGGRANASGGTSAASGGAAPGSGGSVSAAGGAVPASGGTVPASSGGATASAGGSGGGDAGPSPDPGTAQPDAAAPRPHATGLSLATTMEDPKVAPWFKVYRPADMATAVAATGHALPVIAWANGGCFRVAAAWAGLYERWAAGGFVVLALDAGPDGNALAQTTVEDQRKLIDWALAEATKPGSAYAGKLDTTRIVAAGNSCGGVTALGVAAKDDRVKSVFVLSGSSALGSTNTQIMGAIEAPVGYIVGGAEDIAAPNATADYGAMASGVPAMIVNRASGDHILVSTDATILGQEAEIALDWMDLSLYGTAAAHAVLTSATVCTSCNAGVWTLKSKGLEALRR